MTLRSLKTACLVASTIAPMIVAICAKGADGVEQAPLNTPQPIAKDVNWSLRLPKDGNVIYKGDASFDGAGAGSGSMLYPAPNAVGLLAGIVTHGLLVESTRRSQKNGLQETADKVLLPYEVVLSTYKHKDLMERGLEMASMAGNKKLLPFSEKPGTDWFIETTPVFSMTQDQSAIILDNAISIHMPGAPSTAAYQYIVRVVSQGKDEADLPGFWTANGGARLKEESASLFAQSLDIALGELARGSSTHDDTYKTFRYRQGASEKMERGQLVGERCNRVVIKTLRGWLMSVPVRRSAPPDPSEVEDKCGDTLGRPQ